MDILETKLVVMTVLGVVSLLTGFAPRFIFRRELPHQTAVVSVLLCFGGGVLFATSFVHLLPEVCSAQLQRLRSAFTFGVHRFVRRYPTPTLWTRTSHWPRSFCAPASS